MRFCCTILALVFMSASAAFADIVDVSFTEMLSGNGNVFVRCDTCPGGVGIVQLSGSSSSPDFFTGTASFFDVSGRGATLTEQITQTNSSDSTSFDVSTADAFSIFARGAQWSAMGMEFDSFGVTFTLTTASLLNLNSTNPGGGGVLTNNIILLGPAGPIFSSSGKFNTSLSLPPGTYTLTGNDSYMAAFGPGALNSTTTVNFDLNASLAPVPEPRFLALFAVVLLVVVGRFHFGSRALKPE